MARRGATTNTLGYQLPTTGKITRAQLQRVLTELVVQLNEDAVGDDEIAEVPWAKLISGALATGVMLKSYNYATDGAGNPTAGWCFKFDGSIDSPGFKLRPDGTVIIGSGDNKMTVDSDGTISFARNGKGMRIRNDGYILFGGEDLDAMTVIAPDGNITARNQTPDSQYGIDIGQITGLVGNPIISPDGGVFDTTLSITLTPRTAGSTMYYTDDGSTPDSTDNLYTGPFSISATKTIKAIAYKFGTAMASGVSSETFTKNASVGDKVANPAFSPPPNSYSPSGGGQAVTITCPTAGATIRYTTDGSTPSSTVGTIITSGSSVTLTTGTTTLKAIAYKTLSTDSDVVSGVYVISSGGTGTGTQVADPEFEATSGETGVSTLSGPLTCATSGATIYWRRWNGASYTSWTAGTSASIPVNQFIEIKATKAGLLDSNVVTYNNY